MFVICKLFSSLIKTAVLMTSLLSLSNSLKIHFLKIENSSVLAVGNATVSQFSSAGLVYDVSLILSLALYLVL